MHLVNLHVSRIVAVTAAAVLVTSPARAQQSPARVAVNGVVYDSLRSAPLSGALVAIVGTSRSTITDDRGRFHFDSLAPNTYTFTAQHDAIDSTGLSGLATKVRVDGNGQEVRLSVPSFGTLWRALCVGKAETPDTGFVFGSVRGLNGRPADAARIDVSWIDVAADKQSGVRQRRYHLSTRTDAKGGYGVCGVPKEATLQIQAIGDAVGSGTIDLPPRDVRVRRLDLVVGAQGESAPKGVVAGRVTGATGRPVVNARVTIETVPEVRTDSAGRFTMRGVPGGTQQVEVLAIGLAPALQTVDVTPGDTVVVDIIARAGVRLAPVKVTAARQERLAREIAERTKAGFGYTRDSTEIRAQGTVAAVFTGFPSTQVTNLKRSGIADYQIRFSDGHGGTCAAIIWLDGIKRTPDMINFLNPQDIAAVEVYPQRMLVPMDFPVVGNACGVVAIWTKSYVAK